MEIMGETVRKVMHECKDKVDEIFCNRPRLLTKRSASSVYYDQQLGAFNRHDDYPAECVPTLS